MARQRCSASRHGAAHTCATPGAAGLGTNCVQSSTKNHKQHMHLKLSRKSQATHALDTFHDKVYKIIQNDKVRKY
jgi:hypothetical protein